MKSLEIRLAHQLLRNRQELGGVAYDRRNRTRNLRGDMSAALHGADAARHRPLELEVDERYGCVQNAEDFQAE